jgi:hypothetical protein
MSTTVVKIEAELVQLEGLLSEVRDWAEESPEEFSARLTLSSLEARRSLLRQELAAERRVNKVAQVYLKLEGAKVQKGTVEVEVLSSMLRTTQHLVWAIGQALLGQPTTRGVIPDSVRSQMRLRAGAVAVGSFDVELLADAPDQDLFDSAVIWNCLDHVHDLLNVGSDIVGLDEQFALLGPRVYAYYLSLTQNLVKTDTGISYTTWDVDSAERTSTVAPAQAGFIRDSLGKLKRHLEREEALRGTLSGVLQQREDFEFRDVESGHLRSGKIKPEAIAGASAHFNHQVEAKFLVESAALEDREGLSEKWTLVDIVACSDCTIILP